MPGGKYYMNIDAKKSISINCSFRFSFYYRLNVEPLRGLDV